MRLALVLAFIASTHVVFAAHFPRRFERRNELASRGCTPRPLQKAWEGRKELISGTLKQVYRIKQPYGPDKKRIVIKAIPVIDDNTEAQVKEEIQKLNMVQDFVAFGMLQSNTGFGIAHSELGKSKMTAERRVPPFVTYYIAMLDKGDPSWHFEPEVGKAWEPLREEARQRANAKGMEHGSNPDNFVYTGEKYGKPDQAHLTGWSHGRPTSGGLEYFSPIPEVFCYS